MSQGTAVDFINSVTHITNVYHTICVQDWSSMLNDGLHLSPRGSEFLFSLLKPHITKATDHLPLMYPDWKDVDNENPHLALNSS